MTCEEKLRDILRAVEIEIEDTDYATEYHRYISLKLIKEKVERHLNN